jgi:hypothetical protein
MKKSALFTWVFTATLFSVLPLTSLPAKAEGGCPKGFFPVGGGYCRNIVCDVGFDSSTVPIMKKYGIICQSREFAARLKIQFSDPDFKYYGGTWGNMMVPMR